MEVRNYGMVDALERKELDKARKRLDQGLANLSRRDGAPPLMWEMAYTDTLVALMELVLNRNEVINLTSITEPEEFVELHFLDSLACIGMSELNEAKRIIDVGSGLGFPGLPLAMLYPEKQFLLTDSLQKRMEFAAFAAASFGLGNVDVLHARAETAGHDPALREQFDLTLCRAVGPLPVILEYCLPFLRVGGAGLFYKTVQAEEEIEDSVIARRLLGGSAEVRVTEYADLLPGRKHAIYTVFKEKHTPEKYPRREGIPAKAPL